MEEPVEDPNKKSDQSASDETKQVVKRDQEDYMGLTRSEAQNHYRTEATKEEVVKPKEQTAVNKISDFFESKFITWFIHYIRSRFGFRHKFQNYAGTNDNGIYELKSSNANSNGEVSIALVGDWATDTSESDRIGVLIESKKPDYTIHLGDTYFVGMKEEMGVNYLYDNSSWYRGRSGSFTLMGNHEMYSRGISYFRDLIPSMGIYSNEEKKYLGQKTSYFCLENEHWRIISLDTGYNSVGIPLIEYIFKPKYEFHKDIIEWLTKTLDLKNDKRGLVFLTHHQYCSAFEEEYSKPAEQLAEIIGENRKVLWYWGHEHRLAVYGKFKRDKGTSVYGRCIGHGGMPVEFKQKLKEDKAKECNLILYDQRKNTEIKNIDIGYNGFVIMKINEADLKTEYLDINNELLLTEEWRADNQTGNIKGKELNIVSKSLTIYTKDLSKALD